MTAAKNEEAYIAQAIRSVLSQTVLPLAWFIMDDGSTDRTAPVVEEFRKPHKLIRLWSLGSGSKRSFGSKDEAIRTAYDMAKTLPFSFVGMLDADIAHQRADYYETILDEFYRNLRLGIAGGYIYERNNGVWKCRRGNSEDSIAGGIQVFRRTCFEQIGGYKPMCYGGEDTLGN